MKTSDTNASTTAATGVMPPKRNPNIKYVNPELPRFELPAFKGERYQDKVPDTLDLAERAALAVHGLTAMTDAEYDAELYWMAYLSSQPPRMLHDMGDWCEYKYYAPSVLLRQACGSDESLSVEWHRMANLLQMQGPDGLFYVPLIGRPWCKADCLGADFYKISAKEQMTASWFHGRILEAAATYYALTKDERWKQMGDKAVSSLSRLAVDGGDYAYFLKVTYSPEEAAMTQKGPIPPPTRHHGGAWVAMGLTTYYRMTKSQPALDLARKLSRFYLLPQSGFMGPKGEFHGSHEDGDLKQYSPQTRTHFHMNALIRMAMLNAGIESGDRELVEAARQGYAFGRERGNALAGFFPEFLNVPPGAYGNTTELCAVADMLYLALRQSTSGTADCWDDVDRWVRNMFAEAQLTDVGWVQPHSEKDKAGSDPAVTTWNVSERAKGVWGGWVALNEWQTEQSSIMACCVGNSAMTLFRVWRDMLKFEPEKKRLTVHLLLNRASPWADVYSHIPYQGLVEVKLKRDCAVAVRVPEWTTPKDCALKCNGREATPSWEGRYAVVKGKKGETISLSCPIAERTEKLKTSGGEYQVVIKGNEIVDVNPKGTRHPLFQRSQYRQNETRMKQVERFVSEKVEMAY